MLVFVNYNKEEKANLPILASILKKRGVHAVASANTFGISDLLATAKKANASAIIMANEDTLANLVQVPQKSAATLATFRGSRLNFSIPAIVINPLDHVHTVKYGRFLLEKDLEKLAYLHQKPIPLRFKVCEGLKDLFDCETLLEKAVLISIDIETDAYSRITCISFTGLFRIQEQWITETFVIPFIDFGIDHWEDPLLYQEAIETMQNICQNEVPKMMFNNPYDAQYLIKYHAWPNNLVIDVMGMAHSQYSELPKTLDFVASLYCYDYFYWKQEADLAKKNRDIRAYWGYCAKDSWNTLRAFMNMLEQYPQYAITNYQMLYKLIYPCLYCAYEGIKVDLAKREELKKEAQAKLDVALKNLRIMAANEEFNPGSPKQVANFIYNIIGAKAVTERKKDKSGNITTKVSTSEKSLKKVMEQHPLLTRIVGDILTYREEAKAIGTYFEFETLNERVLYSLGPFATDTGRFSSRQSNFRLYDVEGDVSSYGAQVQNIPDYAKEMLVADDGWELFEADNNKSEARCVAFLAVCIALKVVLADRDKDFYKVLGTIFFGIPYDKVTKDLRNKVLKRIIHGTNYMMGVDTFIDHVGVKQIMEGAALLGMKVSDIREFVKFLLGIYHKKFPEVSQWYTEIKREILRTHKLVSPMGYTRFFFGDIINNHKILRGAVAHAPQNLSVTILNKGFWKVYKLVVENPYEIRLKAQIHDSNFGQYKIGLRDKYQQLVLAAMNNPVQVNGDVLSIPVDFKYGRTWKELKD